MARETVRYQDMRVLYGTDLAYGAISLCAFCAVCGTEIPRRAIVVYGAIVLRTFCAMSSTDLAYGAIGLPAYNSMSGTDLAYGATQVELDLALLLERPDVR
eukprot:2258993-Rhodomonas_salina.1